ncbi:unnamed protein product [Alopecurus aequalis]
MQGNRTASVLLVLAAILLVTFAAPAAAGTMASPHLDTSALSLPRRMEDEVAPELSWAASLVGAGPRSIGYDTLKPNRPGCTKQCAAKTRGTPYTSGCIKAYGCRDGN